MKTPDSVMTKLGLKPSPCEVCGKCPTYAGDYARCKKRIELKTEKGRVSPDQKWWIGELRQQGYYAAVCHGWQQAVDVIEWYLEGAEQCKKSAD